MTDSAPPLTWLDNEETGRTKQAGGKYPPPEPVGLPIQSHGLTAFYRNGIERGLGRVTGTRTSSDTRPRGGEWYAYSEAQHQRRQPCPADLITSGSAPWIAWFTE